MVQYQFLAKELLEQFEQVYIEELPRIENSYVDALARWATSDGVNDLTDVVVTTMCLPSILRSVRAQIKVEYETSMSPRYLQNGELSNNNARATRLHLQAARYTILDRHLYKRGLSLPLLKCVTPEDRLLILKQIHIGVCRNHTGGHSLAYKMIRKGYYWPIMKKI